MRLAEGGEWKDAIFWQQPRGYWTPKTKNYQGDYRAAAAQTQQILARLHREDGPVALLRVCQPHRRGHAGAHPVMITSVSTDNTVQGPQNTHHGEETQAPDWANPEDWGELYDLWEDPQENVNLYRSTFNLWRSVFTPLYPCVQGR